MMPSDTPPLPEPLDALVAALRVPIETDAAARQQIMTLVRAAAARPHTPLPTRRPGSTVRTLRDPVVGPLVSSTGLAAAAGVAALIGFGALRSPSAPARPVGARTIIGDTVASALRDTLRLVRFVLRAPFASSVAIAGDFNDWNPRATSLHRKESHDPWSVVLALAPGQHIYSFVVNDTQWVQDPGARAARAHELAPPRSVIDVR
jgi:hypothetical protein